MSTAPAPRREESTSLLSKVGGTITDVILFVIILCFTGIAVIAVAIAAPLALGISAIIGSRREARPGWQPAKAS